MKNFNDPVVTCQKCKSIFRADNLISSVTGDIVPESLSTGELENLIKKHKIKCTKCKSTNFHQVKTFNMMMGLSIGATGKNESYLRPETCQSIFLDFLRIYKTSRKNLPLGIAQVGTSFRNEIAPRNTLLREREIGQMEIEIFFNPKKINEFEKFKEVKDFKLNLMLTNTKKVQKVTCANAVSKKIVSGKLVAYYLARLQQFYAKLGIPEEKIRFRELEKQLGL